LQLEVEADAEQEIECCVAVDPLCQALEIRLIGNNPGKLSFVEQAGKHSSEGKLNVLSIHEKKQRKFYQLHNAITTLEFTNDSPRVVYRTVKSTEVERGGGKKQNTTDRRLRMC
jgi:hypothetical protein